MKTNLIDDISDKLIADLEDQEPTTCEKCSVVTTLSFSGLCESCHDAAKRRAAIEDADAITASIVSPEIGRTEIEHPEFNRVRWEKVMRNWQIEAGDWLWLHSRTSGRCKTRVAFLMVREWVRSQRADGIVVDVSPVRHTPAGSSTRTPDVVWMDGDEFSEACRVRNQFSLGDEAMADAHRKVKDAKKAKLLVLDDLTKRKMSSEAVSDGFWEVIKYRHEWDLITIFTDNIPVNKLKGCLNPKHAEFIHRRLLERCLEADFDASSE